MPPCSHSYCTLTPAEAFEKDFAFLGGVGPAAARSRSIRCTCRCMKKKPYELTAEHGTLGQSRAPRKKEISRITARPRPRRCYHPQQRWRRRATCASARLSQCSRQEEAARRVPCRSDGVVRRRLSRNQWRRRATMTSTMPPLFLPAPASARSRARSGPLRPSSSPPESAGRRRHWRRCCS